ncbi:hypothetical protein RY63_11565 [Salmonella enterica subsp. enterica serovar Typhimurium]|uniref:Ead/Ea22-like family protein n=9 Tax=Salmonella enterica TaxID=28901 RepID=A0A732VWM0_SALDE|nr:MULTISPECIES: hypothetical protein [Salmonella]YP_006365.1 ORF9 [Enterobacteria phage ST104]YP_009279835.1 hypothetical protein BI085_gp58 [Enterobacteria phage UAB_Phi20]ADM32343.1 hypothetical protein Phi75p12 [Enterobacteria phage Phi75]AGK10216.1 hypothetical protein STU288_13070 [Salmonella enterica subsp. enterica serovar Typhimurium str. U288]AGS63787.1 hypothetical protein I137_12355 [Salmonella enterica subsp. enterica serovar Pullorum str. S06004]AUG84786.1 hypothetical protein C
MKQMTLIEMDGFLKGKCIPRDLKVNETNAEYLVRKFAEAEAKISALAEDHQRAIESIKQADSAVKLAHEKFSALASENAALKKSEVEFNEYCRRECEDVGDTWVDDFTDTPATDAFLDEVRAQAFNDLCSAFVKDATVVGLDDGDIVTVKEATDALLHCADQLRKGVHS